MNAFLTGSRVYGKPSETSDVDLVVRVDVPTREALQKLSDCPEQAKGLVVIRFGRLNLIACDNDEQFAAWKFGTAKLIQESKRGKNPIDKIAAKTVFDQFRELLGVKDESNSGTPPASIEDWLEDL